MAITCCATPVGLLLERIVRRANRQLGLERQDSAGAGGRMSSGRSALLTRAGHRDGGRLPQQALHGLIAKRALQVPGMNCVMSRRWCCGFRRSVTTAYGSLRLMLPWREIPHASSSVQHQHDG
jgi:hypothetical protein